MSTKSSLLMWQRVLNMLVLSGLANFRSEDYGLTGITVPRQLPQTKDQIFGCCPQVLQGKHSASVTGSKRPGAHLASTKCHRVTWEITERCAGVRWGPENPQPGCEHPKQFVEPGNQRFLLQSCVRCDWPVHYLVNLREWPLASRWDGSVEEATS